MPSRPLAVLTGHGYVLITKLSKLSGTERLQFEPQNNPQSLPQVGGSR